MSPDPVSNKKWISTPSIFLFPEAVASPIYRRKFREILRAADLEKHVDPSVWRRWWEVNVKPVSDGRAVLKYLAPYVFESVFRVAISDNRILECTDKTVTYKYTPSKSKPTKTRTVDGWKLVRGFLQHVLPKSFLKVRYYGWMASNSRTTRDRVRWLVWLFLGWTYWLGSGARRDQNPIDSKQKRRLCSSVDASIGDHQRTIPSLSPTRMRFPDDCQLKTAASHRSCDLRFPYATCRCNSNGLLEQMP